LEEKAEAKMAAINRLLIVDDKQEITDLVEVFAQGAGYEVLSINDRELFEQALEQIKPTVIFLDMTRPGRDGMALIGSLASSNYPGKVAIMSGSDLADLKTTSTEIRSLMLSAVLLKPFRKQTVMELLKDLSATQ
jgi:two-component system, response regulator YesN